MFASFLHCVRVSGRLSKCICNARKWLCLSQSEQGRQQSPLVQQGMSHLKYITTRLFCLWHVLPASPHLFPQSDKTFHPIRQHVRFAPGHSTPIPRGRESTACVSYARACSCHRRDVRGCRRRACSQAAGGSGVSSRQQAPANTNTHKNASAMKVMELLAGCWLKEIFNAACFKYRSRTRVGPGPITRSSLSFAALFFGSCELRSPRDSPNSLDV